MQVGMRVDMLVVHVGLVGTLVAHPAAAADRLVLVADRRAVLADSTPVSGRQSVEDIQDHQDKELVDFVVHQVKEHQDTGLLHYHL